MPIDRERNMAKKRKSSSMVKPNTQAETKKANKAPKPVFALAKTMLNKLPLNERAIASADLWQKSAGKCALCSLPLDLATKDSVVADHRVPEFKGGKTTISNLYLAHRTCNASRQHLDFNVAQPLVRFRSIAEQNKTVDFDFVIDQFMGASNRLLIEYAETGSDTARVSFGHKTVSVPLAVDPATSVKYFFVEAPMEFIHNDKEIQPRAIMPGHVRKLAIDFTERPVHEPSNCRLVKQSNATARLLQFDGQHKTTAQILIGRKTAPVKVYVEPQIDMLQNLVIKIQQEIKKQPLTKSETLAKIGDVIRRLLDSYEAKPGELRSEKGLIASQPKADQRNVRQLYFNELRRIIFFDEENLLSKAVGPGVADPPTTDKVVIDKIVNPLIYPQPLTIDMDAAGGRDEERRNVLLVLNAIAEKMLPDGWDKKGNDLQRRRAENFFYQGSIGWWMSEILEPSLRYVLFAIGKHKPLFLEPLDEAAKERVLSVVERLCSWPIWSTEDDDALKAMRSNTIKNVSQVFSDYTDKRLLLELAQ